MIKHIVMFKLINKNNENVEKVVNALKTLKGNIDVLCSAEIGVNFNKSDRNYDIVLITKFKDRNTLKTYDTHPKHLPVVETVRSLCSGSVVVDYETDLN
ncbi:MAG TPA: Dabb family protein [Nitrospinaceae bacterium]|jgi:hypothetical protein|nr:Dabb family protein [Nitrospinaceae bacterium]